MKKLIALTFIGLCLSACAQKNLPPAQPADIPPPTNLLQ